MDLRFYIDCKRIPEDTISMGLDDLEIRVDQIGDVQAGMDLSFFEGNRGSAPAGVAGRAR